MSTPVSQDSARPAPAQISQTVPTAERAGALTKRCTACAARYPADFLLCPRDATPLVDEAAQADPLVGRLLGDTYQIVRLVGEGGMGRVYEARHLRLKERRVAVKVLNPDLARDPEVVARFQREAESSSAIAHEHVVDVFDVHRTADGQPYLVGEFLDGTELGQHLARVGRLLPAEAVNVTRQVCRALAAAHDKGIVHRDMKPENVFVLSREGRAFIKVIDFGISKAGHSGATNLTRTGMVMGTPSYMAPEQARGSAVDHRADVYATGALLYHLVTGKKPFDSDDAAATLGMVLTEEPPRPSTVEPAVPAELELVIQRAMAKDPLDRYASMLELDAALAPFDTSAAPSSVPAPSGSAARIGDPARGPEWTARTVFAGAAPGAGSARTARPTIALLGVVIALWLTLGFVDALAGVVRWAHAGELTLTESVLLVLGGALAAATPVVLFAAHVKKSVWRNSVKAVDLAGDLRRTTIAALVTYGAVAFGARVVFTVFLRDAHEIAGGLWDALLFAASALGAAAAFASGPLARRARRGGA